MIEILKEKTAGAEVLKMNGGLTIEHALEIKTALSDALKSGKAVIVSLGAIENADPSFMQMLCSAHRSAVKLGASFSLENNGQDVFSQAARSSGFFRKTGCDHDRTGTCLWAWSRN